MAARKKLSRNASCPCGSGRKYKACCYDKAFHYLVEADGSVVRSVPLNDEVATMLKEQDARFIAKHGRPPGPEDPVFDPADMPDEKTFTNEVTDAMTKAGIDPAFIYAFQKTGLLLTEENRHLVPARDVEEFEAALAEYEERHGDLDGDS